MTQEEQDEDDHTPHDAPQKVLLELGSNLEQLIGPQLNTKLPHESQPRTQNIFALLDFFQEDPQLLDPHLTRFLPPLIHAYLDCINSTNPSEDEHAHILQRRDYISKILCAFCKVRGRKVISRFLDNQSQLIEPLLRIYHEVDRDFQKQANALSRSFERSENVAVDASSKEVWQQQYVIVLWLSCLVLTPFDLSTICKADAFDGETRGVKCPEECPPIALEIMEVGIKSLSSATSQRSVAGDLLVRLCFRVDMRKLGLHFKLIDWALQSMERDDKMSNGIHEYVGLLTFLAGIFASAALDDVGITLQNAYSEIKRLFESADVLGQSLRDSAVAKRLFIKMQREFVVKLIRRRAKPASSTDWIEKTTQGHVNILEDVIDLLLRSLADRDTSVRLAAGKALSIVGGSLDSEMAEEIVEAVIASLNEDVFEENGEKNYSTVDPFKWHGLTMTLSDMLFRQIPTPDQLQDTLNALYMALVFVQRSSSGHLIGGNVRDAANLGFWSLARRYTAPRLSSDESRQIIQVTARHLICAACLDPAGNVRRGSSAALQELVGRHPDTVKNGIALIQVIDYQAVGLRSRAMGLVAFDAALLDESYRDSLIGGVYGWRGLLAPDESSREIAARAIGALSKLQEEKDHVAQLDYCAKVLGDTPARDVEIRHGMLIALAEILEKLVLRFDISTHGESQERALREKYLPRINSLFSSRSLHFGLQSSHLKHPSRRPDFIATGILMLVRAYSFLLQESNISHDDKDFRLQIELLDLFTLSLQIIPEEKLELVQTACEKLLQFLGRQSVSSHGFNEVTRDSNTASVLIRQWLDVMMSCPRLARIPGVQIALGVAYSQSRDAFKENDSHEQNTLKDSLLLALARNARSPTEIPARVVAIRALRPLIKSDCSQNGSWHTTVLEVLQEALSDFTVSERGDVGSLVRVEAIRAIQDLWRNSTCRSILELPLARDCYLLVLTLAVGKLDKVRMEAVNALKSASVGSSWVYPKNRTVDVSSIADVDHFLIMAALLKSPTEYNTNTLTHPQSEVQHKQSELLAVLEGFAICAGEGASATLSAARIALAETLDELPTFPQVNEGHSIRRSVLNIANGISQLIANNLQEDRVLVPLLETTAFLLDFGILQRLQDEVLNASSEAVSSNSDSHKYKFRTLLFLVQKAHFKSSNVSKLLAAVDVYGGLYEIEELKKNVLEKLAGMLQHPFPRVRVHVAETLWMLTGDEHLKPKIWTEPSANHRSFVADFKNRHIEMNHLIG